MIAFCKYVQANGLFAFNVFEHAHCQKSKYLQQSLVLIPSHLRLVTYRFGRRKNLQEFGQNKKEAFVEHHCQTWKLLRNNEKSGHLEVKKWYFSDVGTKKKKKRKEGRGTEIPSLTVENNCSKQETWHLELLLNQFRGICFQQMR